MELFPTHEAAFTLQYRSESQKHGLDHSWIDLLQACLINFPQSHLQATLVNAHRIIDFFLCVI